MSATERIIDAYLFLRENNHSIPSEVLDYMKDAALEKLATEDVGPRTVAQCYKQYQDGGKLTNEEWVTLRDTLKVAAESTFSLGDGFRIAFLAANNLYMTIDDICRNRGIG